MRLPTPVLSGADPRAFIWYRLTFDLPRAPEGTWAVFVRRAEDHVAFFNEGEPTAIADRADQPPASRWNYPRYFELKSAVLHAGRNILYARVRQSSVGEHQLSVVMLGPATELLDMFRRQLVLQVIGPLTASAVAAVVGLFALALWLHRRTDTAFAWLGLACAFMILHFARFFLAEPPVPTFARAIGDGSFGWMVLALMLFVFRMAEQRHRRIEPLVALYALAGTIRFYNTDLDKALKAKGIKTLSRRP